MEAVAWTAICLLGATQALLLAAVFHLGSRIDAQGQGLREAIDAQTARIDSLNVRMDVHMGQQHTA